MKKHLIEKNKQIKNVKIQIVLEQILNGLNVVKKNVGITKVVQEYPLIKHKKKLIRWIGNVKNVEKDD